MLSFDSNLLLSPRDYTDDWLAVCFGDGNFLLDPFPALAVHAGDDEEAVHMRDLPVQVLQELHSLFSGEAMTQTLSPALWDLSMNAFASLIVIAFSGPPGSSTP